MSLLQRIIDFTFPRRCLACKILIADFGLCGHCWQKVHFISAPACAICHYPFEFEADPNAICGYCVQEKPIFDKAFALIKHKEVGQELIKKFKFNDQTHLAKLFALWSEPVLKKIAQEIDYIIPVPIHRFRLWKRQYNQASILADAISSKIKVQNLNLVLAKITNNPPQTTLSKIQRKQISKNSYQIRKKYLNIIKNKNILLIDDVYTTGSTINECSKILKKSGVRKVFVVTISRTTIE